MRRRLAPLVLLLAPVVARLAFAAGVEEPIRLDYRAAPGCPDEPAFLARVRARTSHARLADRDEPARTFTLRLEGGGRPSGSVTVSGTGAGEGTRALAANTCEEVADALALMMALAIDARAPAVAPTGSAVAPLGGDLDAGVAFDAAPIDAAVTPGAIDASAVIVDAGADFDAATQVIPQGLPDIQPARASVVDGPASPRHFFAGADFAVATGVSPVVILAGAPYVGWRSLAPRLLGVSVRAAFLRAGTGVLGLAGTGGTADFTWTVGRLDGCAMLGPERTLRVGACGRLELGELDVAGGGVPGARTQDTAWAAVGLLARGEWSFYGPFVLDAAVGPSFRILPDKFDFGTAAPYTPGYDVPALGLFAEAGLGLHFL